MVLMENDIYCPSCGTATPLITAAGSPGATTDPNVRRKFIVRKWCLFLLALFVGGLVILFGAGMSLDAQSNRPTPRQVTAGELAHLNNLESMPGWITYLPGAAVDTGVEYVKVRSRQARSKFVLLEVEDHWLLAKIDPRFKGTRYEGQLTSLDTVALPKVREAFPGQAAKLLPFQLDAEYDIAGTQRRTTMYGIGIAAFGALVIFTGIGKLQAKPPRIVAPAPTAIGSGAASQLALQDAPRATRGWFLRVIFMVIWAVVFFFTTAIALSIWSTLQGGDDPAARQQLAEQAGKTVGPWSIPGSIVLAVFLGVLGKLPGTRR
jgi:hypothetical protein